MGEPMANLDRVLAAIEIMIEPSALAIDARAITVCTSGLPAGIRRLAREAPKVRLGVSIGSALGETRRRLMPIERSHALAEVLEAAAEHAATTGLAPMWAITLLGSVNDDAEHAVRLAEHVLAFRERTGRSPRLSIVPYNTIGGDGASPDPFTRSSDDRERAFREVLRERGVHSHRRYSGGGDVDAACGQLTARAAP
jgi:23S rRNA (adenine2503-C2)-methyltransferase